MQKLSDRLDRPIVLVGLMGAGKSTVGRRLARRLGLPFVDTDSEIEEATGQPWGELFERYGEADFRDGECRLVARVVDGQVRVISTGGGVFVDTATREMLNARAITVWLDAPVDVLANRTARRNTRPLLRSGDARQTLEQLSEQERPSYAEAHIHVKSGDGAHKDIVEAIIAAVIGGCLLTGGYGSAVGAFFGAMKWAPDSRMPAVQMEAADLPMAQQLLPQLEEKVGRILVNGWPTGVDVGEAMVHGGPFPATSDSRTTSVGTLAIERFLRPVAYQNIPDTLLPAPVQQANPWHLNRRIDGTVEAPADVKDEVNA